MNKCSISLLTVGASWSGPSILFLGPFRTEYNEYCWYQIPCFIMFSRTVKTNCYVIVPHKPSVSLIKLLCQQCIHPRQVYITGNNSFDACNLIIFAVFKTPCKCTNKFILCCLCSNTPIQSWSFADSCHQSTFSSHALYADNFILSALLALVSRCAVCARLARRSYFLGYFSTEFTNCGHYVTVIIIRKSRWRRLRCTGCIFSCSKFTHKHTSTVQVQKWKQIMYFLLFFGKPAEKSWHNHCSCLARHHWKLTKSKVVYEILQRDITQMECFVRKRRNRQEPVCGNNNSYFRVSYETKRSQASFIYSVNFQLKKQQRGLNLKLRTHDMLLFRISKT